MNKTFLIASGTGGAGKTTVALSLAFGFAKRNLKVLLVETSCGMGVIDLKLNGNTPILYNLGDLLCGDAEVDDVINESSMGFKYICAPTDYEYSYDSDAITTFIKQQKDLFDIIIIDTSSGYSDVHKILTPIVDTVILVTIPQLTDVRLTSNIAEIFNQNKVRHTRLVINKIPEYLPRGCGLDDLDRIIDLVGVRLLGAIPSNNINCLTLPTEFTKKLAIEANALAPRLMGEDIDLVLYK